MRRYTFTGLNAASASGPGPVLWFPSPRELARLSAQFSLSGSGNWTIDLEATLNGSDFRSFATIVNSGGTYSSGDFIALASTFPILIGFRANLVSVDPGTAVTVLLGIDEED